MGFFDKLFSKSKPSFDTSKLSKTAKMMPEDEYWQWVAKSITAGRENQDEQIAFLEENLQKLSPEEIISFKLRTDKLLHDTYTSELWCAGYIMMGGCSDDSFEYFRLWIISNGKDAYYAAKQNPDSLVVFDGEGVDFDFEEFWYVANNAFEKKTGQDLYDYIDEDNFKTGEGNYPDIEFTWEEEDEESMRKLCPKLFEKFWNS